MTINTQKRIQHSGKKSDCNVRSGCRVVLYLMGLLFVVFGTFSPALATEQEAIITGFSVQPAKKTECQDKLICRLEKLKDLIKDADIELELEINLRILKLRLKFKLSPGDKKKLGLHLSQLERSLLQEGKLSSDLKAELLALKELVKQA